MNATSLRPHQPNRLQPMPLALNFSSRLLLTERCSASEKSVSAASRAETIRIRLTLVTAPRKEILGYRHGGINE
jgi:hypothetical protein